VKRFVDIVLASVMLVGTSPLLLLAAIVVRWRLGSPVLFRQARAGRHGEPFTIVKLRSMTDARDEAGALLPDEQRLTRLGRILRSTSLDELPEMWNVVCGQMSLVGPRPLPIAYLGRFTPREARRHEVLPGITGLAQVSGRNALSWEERLELDVVYVETRSFRVDLMILLKTVNQVLSRSGITAEGHSTMEELRPSGSADAQ
jgi:sugar transferase EpsL